MKESTIQEKRKSLARFFGMEYFNEYDWKDLMKAILFIETNYFHEVIIRRNSCEIKSLNTLNSRVLVEKQDKMEVVFDAIYYFTTNK